MNSKNIISNSSNIYADALFKATEGISVQIKDQFEAVCNLLEESSDLTIILQNPSVAKTKKHEIIEELFKNKINQKLLNFLKILIDKDRFSEVYGIFSAYNNFVDKSLNKKNVEIISSFELDNNIKSKIKGVVQKKLNSDALINWTVDKNIIAGLVFKFDDTVVDLSIKSRLESFSKNLLR